MNMKRFFASVILVSASWFIFPIITYGLFERFFGLVPPAGFGWADLLIMIPINVLGAVVFSLIFFLAKGSKIGESGLLYGFLWLLGFSVVSEVGFWLVFKFSPIIMIAGITCGLGAVINGVVVEKLRG